MEEAFLKRAENAFKVQAQCLEQVFERLDRDAFIQAVKALSSAPRIAASACGHSGIACRHFAHLMCCIERPAKFIPPSEAVHGGLGYVQKGDVMLLASRGGKTAELLPILQVCRKKGATVIAVTQNGDSPLARDADIVLHMHVTEEVDPYNSQGTTSHTVLNAIFDALQSAVLEYTGFAVEQFALIHPGGAVGERLNKKG